MTKQALFIPKQKGEALLSFEDLRHKGIEQCIKLGGHLWTDYNTHDPGVTLIEQLCFALSDIAYRCDFPILDYLVADNDDISFEQLSLHLPQDIFPAHPSTQSDLIDTFESNILEIDNISVVPANTNALNPCLIDIYVAFDDIYLRDDNTCNEGELLTQIKQCYAQNRSLNENVHQIRIKRRRSITLHGEIVIQSAFGASEVLANIYFHILQKISRIQHIIEKHDNQQYVLKASELYHALSGIDAITGIIKLGFSIDGSDDLDRIVFNPQTESISLVLPLHNDEFTLQIICGNKQLPLHYARFASEYTQLSSDYKKHKRITLGNSHGYLTPSGVKRDLDEYLSITTHFPPNYKLAHQQLLSSASEQERAHNLQFKAYIGVFDQLLSKQNQSLYLIQYLFAPVHACVGNKGKDITLDAFSTPINALHDGQVANLSQIVSDTFKQDVNDVSLKYAEFEKRALNILDYFLAMYGEKMHQDSLSMFSQAHSQQALQQEELVNKIRMLQHIKAITKDRLKAPNLCSPKHASELGGMQLKIAVLLGFDKIYARQLYRLDDNDNGLHLIEHGLLGQYLQPDDIKNSPITALFFTHQVSVIFPNWTHLTRSLEFQKLAMETVAKTAPSHIFAHVLFVDKTTMRKLDEARAKWLNTYQQTDKNHHNIKHTALALSQVLCALMPAYRTQNSSQTSQQSAAHRGTYGLS